MEIYEAAFKRRKSGKLLWAIGSFENETKAQNGLQSYVQDKYKNQGYNLYAGCFKVTRQ